MNFGVLKRPKVFITFAEIIFSIVAFSVLASYSDTLKFNVVCKESSDQQSDMVNLLAANSIQDALAHDVMKSMRRAARSGAIVLAEDSAGTTEEGGEIKIGCNVTVQYPFKLDKYANESNCEFCNKTTTHIIMKDTSSSMAIFFMFVAVISFLFGLVMIPLYFVQDDIISKLPFFPTLDLIVHAIFLIFWICASISWAAGIANLKYDTSEEQIHNNNDNRFGCNDDIGNTCSVIPPDTYGATVTSVIFGFVNIFLYGANLFFVFKDETFQS